MDDYHLAQANILLYLDVFNPKIREKIRVIPGLTRYQSII